MADSIEAVKNHRAFRVLESLKETVARSLDNDELISTPQWQRFFGLYEFLSTNMEGSDLSLIPTHQLANVVGPIQNANSELNTYLSNSNIGHISTAINELGAGVNLFPTVYRHRFKQPYKSQLDAVMEGFSKLSAKLQNEINKLSEDSSSSHKRVESLKVSLDELQQRVDSFLTNSEQQGRQKLEQISSQYASLAAQFEQNFNEASSKQQEKFSSDLSDVSEKADSALSRFERAAQNQIDKSQRSVDSYIEHFKSIHEIAESDISEKLEKIRKIYGIVGEVSITGSFVEQHKKEKDAADGYRLLGIILMIAAASVSLVPYVGSYFGLNFDITLDAVLARIPFSTLLLIPAGYAVRESGKHRDLARQMKLIQLQMSALDPFIADFDLENQREIKAALIDRYFTGASSNRKLKSEAADTGMAEEIAKMLRELVAKS